MKITSWVNFYKLSDVSLLFFIRHFTFLLFVCCLYLKNPRANIKYLPNSKQVLVTRDLYTRYWKIRFYKMFF